MTNKSDEDLAAWAAAGKFDTTYTPERTLVGEDAAAFGRELLAAAGVDVADVLNRGGRPRLDPDSPAGTTAPRVSVPLTDDLARALKDAADERGVKRTVIVREALTEYLRAS